MTYADPAARRHMATRPAADPHLRRVALLLGLHVAATVAVLAFADPATPVAAPAEDWHGNVMRSAAQ